MSNKIFRQQWQIDRFHILAPFAHRNDLEKWTDLQKSVAEQVYVLCTFTVDKKVQKFFADLSQPIDPVFDSKSVFEIDKP